MNKNKTKDFFFKILLLILSSLLFMLANPNFIVKEGIGVLGFIIYLPVFILIKKSNLKSVWLYGALYGAISYALYGYWLQSFHPLGLIIAVVAYTLILAFVFLGLKIIDLLFKKNAWIVQWLFICCYEYIKTLGFAGFNYGVTAYTQWKFTYLIQICDIFGVFVFNSFVIFPSAFIFGFFNNTKQKNKLLNNLEIEDKKITSNTAEFVLKQNKLALNSRKIPVICASIWLGLFSLFLAYGIIDINKKNKCSYITVAAIQNNESPWENSIEEYYKNIRNLMDLSTEAMQINPEIKLIVWPETSVVPSIMYNYYYNKENVRYKIVDNLLNYMNSTGNNFVIGNAHQVMNNNTGVLEKYNCAFFFEAGKNIIPPEPGIYAKMKLVPFSEEFPYDMQFPRLYKLLLNGDKYMWEKGKEYKIFQIDDLKFSTPICFEDTFDYICRNMVLKGSRCFVNLSNDSWSNSVSCQNQHLAMAVFRSVENRVPAVRSTSSGKTCIINENGVIEKQLPDFCISSLIGKIPVYTDDYKISFFTKTGNIFINIEIVLLLLILIIQIIKVIIKKYSK